MMKKKRAAEVEDKSTKKQQGRPKTLHADLTERFQIRCSPADIKSWKNAAEHAGHTSVGAWIRNAAIAALKSSR